MVSIWIQELPINAVMIYSMITLVWCKAFLRMAPQKLSDANLESLLWNKVIKLQKEFGQMTKGSLQELFQKLLKAEEVIKERERRNSTYRGSGTSEFRNKANYRAPAQTSGTIITPQFNRTLRRKMAKHHCRPYILFRYFSL